MTAIPEPPRPLGPEGFKLWHRIWMLEKSWISDSCDLDHIVMLCESMDERVALRVKVLREHEWRDRVALRTLDSQIVSMLGQIGLNSTDRAKLDTGIVEEPKHIGKLAAIRDSIALPAG